MDKLKVSRWLDPATQNAVSVFVKAEGRGDDINE